MKKLLVLATLFGMTALCACKESGGGGIGGGGGFGGGGGAGGGGVCLEIGDPCDFSDECCSGFCSDQQQCE